jgi:hypothetical protein
MADEPTAETVSPERIRDAFTSRELGTWETTLGLSLTEFGSAHMAAMLSWWAAHQDGDERTPDEFLDMSLSDLAPWVERAVELLGKAPTGGVQLSGTSADNGSTIPPSSPTSTESLSM